MHVLALPSRPKLLTSQSTDRADKLRTDPNATPSASVCDGASEAGSSVSGSMRIRFAPLPDPRRPRRYSTGRDIWLEGEEHLHLKGEVEADPDSWNEPLPGVDKLLGSFSPALEAPGSAISETFSTNSLSPGIGTSASSTLSIGRKGHKKSESISSLTSKLLNSLGIGRRKSGERSLDRTSSIESSTSARNISAWMSGGEPLSRRISTGGISSGFDSEQRGAAEFETMGVPMRRTKSTDKDQPARRAYPSVAQGGQRRQRETSANSTVEEPAFQEWTNPTAGNSITGSGTTQVEEDDGSGMAWLRKRRLEREQKAREEAKIIASAGPSVEDGESPSEAADAPHSPEIVAQIAVIPASPGFEGDKDSERPARTPGVRHNATADSGRLSPYLENDEEDENETERGESAYLMPSNAGIGDLWLTLIMLAIGRASAVQRRLSRRARRRSHGRGDRGRGKAGGRGTADYQQCWQGSLPLAPRSHVDDLRRRNWKVSLSEPIQKELPVRRPFATVLLGRHR